jgi:RecA/RadA recombinase
MSRKKKKDETEQIAEALTADRETKKPIPEEDWLSTGMTVLNLAITGRPFHGIPKGKAMHFVGDSSSGKSWFSLNLFAEAAQNKQFDGYRFVFDNAENGALMDVERYFGASTAKRIRPPAGSRDEPVYSETIEQFYFHADAALDRGPCIYVLDSMDALNANDDEHLFEAQREAFENGKASDKGSYGMAKAKANSNHIKRVVRKLRTTGSILVVISQTRDKIGGSIPGLKTHSGGRATKFFAHVQLWTSVRGPLTKPINGIEREVGSTIRVDIQKNRLSGWEGKIELPFYRSLGFDDLGSCVDYLYSEGHWEGTKTKAGKLTKITAPEFEFEGKPEALIAKIEEENSERELRMLVANVWDGIEEQIKVVRKPRYK